MYVTNMTVFFKFHGIITFQRPARLRTGRHLFLNDKYSQCRSEINELSTGEDFLNRCSILRNFVGHKQLIDYTSL